MRSVSFIAAVICAATDTLAFDQLLAFNEAPEVEQRSIDDIYQAALAEGGIVTCWHGGDSPNQQDGLKTAFEARFPGMTLNLTTDFSKYHGVRLDQQLATDSVYVDSIISETLQDYPRWRDEGALMHYKPLAFEKIYPAYRDANAAWYGVGVVSWSFAWNTNKSTSIITSFNDFLKPEYKDKLVLTYPNDDDAVLYAFDLIMQDYGLSWFNQLLAQNPRWVRGTYTSGDLVGRENDTAVATFTTDLGFAPGAPYNISYPTQGQFVMWPQGAGILKAAPHPEGAKLLHTFYLSEDYQKAESGWSVRSDITVPGQPFDAANSQNTDPTEFLRWMSDRPRVERLRTFFEDIIGQPQGLSPLKGGLY